MRIGGLVVVAFLAYMFVHSIGDYDVVGPDGVLFCGILLAAGVGHVLGVFKPK